MRGHPSSFIFFDTCSTASLATSCSWIRGPSNHLSYLIRVPVQVWQRLVCLFLFLFCFVLFCFVLFFVLFFFLFLFFVFLPCNINYKVKNRETPIKMEKNSSRWVTALKWECYGSNTLQRSYYKFVVTWCDKVCFHKLFVLHSN